MAIDVVVWVSAGIILLSVAYMTIYSLWQIQNKEMTAKGYLSQLVLSIPGIIVAGRVFGWW